jgi:hypothetical protein
MKFEAQALFAVLFLSAQPGIVVQAGLQDCSIPDLIAPGCGEFTCETTVCAVDPYCCNNLWDGLCVNEACELCDSSPTLSSCPGNSPPIVGGNDECWDYIQVSVVCSKNVVLRNNGCCSSQYYLTLFGWLFHSGHL